MPSNRREFTATESAAIVGVSIRRIMDWGGRGPIVAEVKKSTGPGSRRIYSENNLVQMAFLREAFRLGCTRSQVKNGMKLLLSVTWNPLIVDSWIIRAGGEWICESFPDPKRRKQVSLVNFRSFIAINITALELEIAEKIL